MLSAELEVLGLPDVGGLRINTVNASMAGMRTIALFPVVFLGQRVEARVGRRAALAAVATASFVVFVGSEAVAWRIPTWHVQNVAMVGGAALYVVVPEILLGLATVRVFHATAARPLGIRRASAAAGR